MKVYRELHFDNRLPRCFRPDAGPRPGAVHQLLRTAVAGNPDGEALVCGQTRISYRELDALTHTLACRLHERGVGKGDRIGVLLGNRPEFVYVILAAARLEAISVPLNVRLQTPELAYVLGHCGAKVLVHEADLAARLPAAAELPELAQYYAVGGEVTNSTALTDLLQPGAAGLPEPAPHEDDVAVILYTSGTTGRPKGAMLTHLGIVHSALTYELGMGLSARDRSIMPVPASHVTGLIANIFAMLKVSGCTVMLPAFKAGDFLRQVEAERVTHTVMVPAMYNLCLLEDDFDSFDLSGWRIGAYGGAPMPEATIARLAQKLPRLQLLNAYGATETTSPTTLMPLGDAGKHADSVGRPVPGAEVLIVDADGREVEPGTAGEVWIKGPMVVPGYWRDPEATAASFVEGYWRSGDVGALDGDGYLRVFDRLKDMINRGGYKVYSVEVENALMQHPEVLECAVVARADPVLGEKIHAFVRPRRPKADSDVDAATLQGFCAGRLADYKVPDFISFREQPLPRNANGKLLKRELRADTA